MTRTFRTTARLATIIGVLPIAGVVLLGATPATADKPVKPGPTTSANTVQGPYAPVTGDPAGNGGKARSYEGGYLGVPADSKNPWGQVKNGLDDRNNGYECDGNKGVGRGNPAHSSCLSVLPTFMD